MCNFSALKVGVTGKLPDIPSPSDILKNEAVVYDRATGKLTVDFTKTNIPFTKVPDVWACGIPGSFSMDPLFDKEGMNAYLAGADPAEQKIMVDWIADQWLNPPESEGQKANIIVYRAPDGQTIVHRLKEIKVDKDGSRLWKFRGDNPGISSDDPWEVGDESILYVLATIIY